MHRRAPVIRPAGAQDVTRSDQRPDRHHHRGQVRIRRPHAPTVMDRDRQATGHRTRKRHHPQICRPHHRALIGREIDAPMATVCAFRCERPDNCPGHGRLQRASQPEDHDEEKEWQGGHHRIPTGRTAGGVSGMSCGRRLRPRGVKRSEPVAACRRAARSRGTTFPVARLPNGIAEAVVAPVVTGT